MNREFTFTSLTYLLWVLEKQKDESVPINKKNSLKCLLLRAIASSPHDSETMFALIDANRFPGNRQFRKQQLQYEIGRSNVALDDRYIPPLKIPIIRNLCKPGTLEGMKGFYDHSSSEWKKLPISQRKKLVDARLKHVRARRDIAHKDCIRRCKAFVRNNSNFKHAITELRSICPHIHGPANQIAETSSTVFESHVTRRLISLDEEISSLWRLHRITYGDPPPLEIIRAWIRDRQKNDIVNGMKSIYRCYYEGEY